ncbi:hypothetical protein CONLIGDRAFT_643885 [Coniochaeta ligniaria NRRL 30616]|uniref:Uncharacterized protein n=1 Tax=Coniochaeta ligniaria NRRL 30616 TaxID=1408157 RepID=A0A1J7JQ12_9PEZI|nr:hypothetical protein CONLIGDRAFT_643885 [Coniochaeta ligniaria NRRL 30616]
MKRQRHLFLSPASWLIWTLALPACNKRPEHRVGEHVPHLTTENLTSWRIDRGRLVEVWGTPLHCTDTYVGEHESGPSYPKPNYVRTHSKHGRNKGLYSRRYGYLIHLHASPAALAVIFDIPDVVYQVKQANMTTITVNTSATANGHDLVSEQSGYAVLCQRRSTTLDIVISMQCLFTIPDLVGSALTTSNCLYAAIVFLDYRRRLLSNDFVVPRA